MTIVAPNLGLILGDIIMELEYRILEEQRKNVSNKGEVDETNLRNCKLSVALINRNNKSILIYRDV